MKKRQLSVASAESRSGRFQSSSGHSALCPFYDFQKYYLRKWGHFRHPGKSLIAPKSHVWGTTRTLTLEKCSPGGVSGKTLKIDEKTIRKWEVFDSSEPRLALYSSLISHFFDFRKRLKNRCQKGGQKLSFLIQNATLDAQGSIYPTFFYDFGKYEKSMIFRCRSGRRKVD